MHTALVAALALFSAPTLTNDTTFDIGEANWAAYPELRTASGALPVHAMMARMETILREGRCELRGQRPGNFDVTVPWLMEVGQNGRISRVVIADMGCRPLEEYVATLIEWLAREGRFRLGADGRPGWYGSNFNFTLSTSR